MANITHTISIIVYDIIIQNVNLVPYLKKEFLFLYKFNLNNRATWIRSFKFWISRRVLGFPILQVTSQLFSHVNPSISNDKIVWANLIIYLHLFLLIYKNDFYITREIYLSGLLRKEIRNQIK